MLVKGATAGKRHHVIRQKNILLQSSVYMWLIFVSEMKEHFYTNELCADENLIRISIYIMNMKVILLQVALTFIHLYVKC